MARHPTKQLINSRRCKRSRENMVSYFDNVPNELISEVLARVASSSVTDLFSAKSSCKVFRSIGEESYIYRHATLEKFPIVRWWWPPGKEEISSFIDRCWESGNPEALYRQGVIDYFGGTRVDFAFECLKKAAKSGNLEALYVVSIILIFCGNEYKKKGIKMLSEMKKMTMLRRKVRECRKSLKEILRMIWIKNSLILEQRPTCCIVNQHNIKKTGWQLLEDDEEDNIECGACLCDKEVASICNMLP